jgi:GcrA cell cycle regulator
MERGQHPPVRRRDAAQGFRPTAQIEKGSPMSWTDERIETLAKLWLGGLSASRIAAELGSGITRNAVIGKVHRLGLSGRAKTVTTPSPRVRTKPVQRSATPRQSGHVVRGNTALAIAEEMIVHVAPRPIESIVVPISEPVTLVDLREAMCRWPIGDPQQPEFRFCGAKSPSGAPYCEGHRRMAYQPVQDRRRDRERRMQQQMRIE